MTTLIGPSQAHQQRVAQIASATDAANNPPPPPPPIANAPEVSMAQKGAGRNTAAAMAGTLLTGPRGVLEPANTAKKALLGA